LALLSGFAGGSEGSSCGSCFSGRRRRSPIVSLKLARTINAAADQLKLCDQPVIAFQELIAFLGESLVEVFELVNPASQVSDFTFELVTVSSYSECSRRSSA
jgi:hypothetical protein